MTINLKAVADELNKAALGYAYFGNAFIIAKGLPFLSAEDKDCLDRCLSGLQRGMDHVALQTIAIKIAKHAEPAKEEIVM